MAAQETGKEVEWTAESNYHFRLSALKEPLLAFYKQNPHFVVPATRMRDIERWVSEGLDDLSISRPINRLTWGIRVPQDDSQTIYVWLDALVNYITKAGFPSASFFDGVAGWPADVHVIGKDIMRFHCIYWPAFLLALDLPPPKQVLTHAHWTLGHSKMAKSTGNVVNPFFAMDRFGVDAMRFYLAHDGGISDDADYANANIVERYKKCLSGGLGNLLQRVTGAKTWSVAAAVEAAAAGELEGMENPIVGLHGVGEVVDGHFEELNPRAGLHEIMRVIYDTNKYLQSTAPWTIAKQGTPESETEVRRIIFHASEALRVSAILLQPYMPTKAREILDVLGVEQGRRGFFDAVVGGDLGYGTAKTWGEGGEVVVGKKGKGAYGTIFPPLAVEE
ncbi:hypothetical protein GMDG_05131 [Pseudogymnoascus destructans 20631-21]|uniref:methionine--tRNA ligase n=2 Tax=Pseudogymnoascus destructans TaxID=655981 RepID=L8FNB4_PSED2|nr:hypothetical protein GMDG_05131 [Pseudogymnoascus destructans 20631-21]